MKGCPLTTGEPVKDELLPCDDTQWADGVIGHNGHVLSPFDEGLKLGRYAQLCQAAHMLGRVQLHRIDKSLETSFRLDEAVLLDKTLVALHTNLHKPTAIVNGDYCAEAIAICCSARFLLYELYACNEHYEGAPTGQEAHVQVLALQGIEQCVATMYQLALRMQQASFVESSEDSIFVSHALYWAASECRWYIKEGKQEAGEVFVCLVSALKLLNGRSHRAGK
jgi:hypothetical protein